MRNCIRQWLLYGDISDVVEFESQRTFLRKIEIYSLNQYNFLLKCTDKFLCQFDTL